MCVIFPVGDVIIITIDQNDFESEAFECNEWCVNN